MFVKTNGATSSNYIFILGMAIIGQLMVTVNGQMTSGNEASVQTGETRCVGIQPNLSEWMQQMETLLRSVQDGIKTLNEHQFTLDQQADDRFDGCPSYRKRGGTGVSCPSLRSFTNANLSTTHVAYGTKVNVSCSSRQQLMTSSSNWIITECQADGTWSVKPSNCMSSDPGTPTLAYALSHSTPVTGIMLHNDEIFVVCNHIDYVLVYDSVSLRLKSHIKIPGLRSSEGSAISPSNNYLYIADHDNVRVNRVDLSTNIVTGWNVPVSHLNGVSVTGNGNVLVASYQASKVLEYTPNGLLVRELTDSNHLFHAVEIGDGTLLVSRSHPTPGVVQMTREGRVIRSFGSTAGSGTTQMNHPRLMAVDSEGSVFIADLLNNRIQLLNPSLKLARTLPLPESIILSQPWAVCYDESRGRLFVGEIQGQNRLLVFDGVTNVY